MVYRLIMISECLCTITLVIRSKIQVKYVSNGVDLGKIIQSVLTMSLFNGRFTYLFISYGI